MDGGYVKKVEFIDDNKQGYGITLKYRNKQNVISGIKRSANPSQGYVNKDELPQFSADWVLPSFHIQRRHD